MITGVGLDNLNKDFYCLVLQTNINHLSMSAYISNSEFSGLSDALTSPFMSQDFSLVS